MSIDKARTLRTQSADAEIRLWYLLRDRRLQGFRFRRQHPIGKFIADFACTKYRLIIEADGGQHAENSADAARTVWLEKRGWQVLLFWNNDILSNTDGVMETLLAILNKCEKQRSQKQPFPHSTITCKGK
jgi:primosomal protein N' (replication factor Y)